LPIRTLSISFFHHDPPLDERLDVERPVDLDVLDFDRVELLIALELRPELLLDDRTALELRPELLLDDRTALELRPELLLDDRTRDEEPVDRPVERLPELRTVPLELLPLLPEDLTVRPVERPVDLVLPALLYMLLDRVDVEGVLSHPERAFCEADRV
jgi:hypothetical protein